MPSAVLAHRPFGARPYGSGTVTRSPTMPTLTRDRRSDTDMKLKDLELPKMDLSKLDLSKFELPKVDLSKVEIPKLERPTPDELGKAVAAAATTIGLAKAKPRRWPYLVA